MKHLARAAATAAAVLFIGGAASAAPMTAGPGGFNDGWATSIIYDDAANRGTNRDRDNPLNAFGPTDGAFFEIGLNSSVDVTFGTLFTGIADIVELTTGSVLASYLETVDVFAGFSGSFDYIGNFSNQDAQASSGGVLVDLGTGIYDTLRLVDTTDGVAVNSLGFDIDSIRVTPIPPALVPVPAAGLLLVSALGAAALLRRRKTA